MESVHATIETEFYALQTFTDRRDFLGQAATSQLLYNLKHKKPLARLEKPRELP